MKSNETYTVKYRKSCFDEPDPKTLNPDDKQTQENTWTLKSIFTDLQIGDNPNTKLTELDFGDDQRDKSFNVTNKGASSGDDQASCSFELKVDKSDEEWLLPLTISNATLKEGEPASITVKIDRTKLPDGLSDG